MKGHLSAPLHPRRTLSPPAYRRTNPPASLLSIPSSDSSPCILGMGTPPARPCLGMGPRDADGSQSGLLCTFFP